VTEADAARIETLEAENALLKQKATRALEGLWAVLMTHCEGEAHVELPTLDRAIRGHVQAWACADGSIMFKALEADDV
jgi:hypothetical protein